MKKTAIVYVSGAPGSGKTTLAKLLSEQLYIPHVSSDLIHGGVALLQPEHDRKHTLQHVFIPTMVAMAKKGVSFVADHVLQKGIAETTIIDKLRPYATIVYVHTQTADPIERYIDRTKHSQLPSIVSRRRQLLERADTHKQNLKLTDEPLALDAPLIVVNTDNGYNPSLERIVAFIKLHCQA